MRGIPGSDKHAGFVALDVKYDFIHDCTRTPATGAVKSSNSTVFAFSVRAKRGQAANFAKAAKFEASPPFAS
jgi:hypothetical protein